MNGILKCTRTKDDVLFYYPLYKAVTTIMHENRLGGLTGPRGDITILHSTWPDKL